MIAIPDHRNRVLEHQTIAQLFNCPLEELFEIYQRTEPEADDTSWMRLIYAIGSWRFGPRAWSDRHVEYFKERARERAGSPPPAARATRQELEAMLKDLGL